MWLKLVILFIGATTLVAGDSPRWFYDDLQEGGDITAISPKADPYDGIVYRLPNDTLPLTYDIWLSTDIHLGEFAFDGRVTIRFRVIDVTQEVTVQYRMMTVNTVTLFNSNDQLIEENVSFFQNATVEFLVIRPTEQLILGQDYSVLITYNATIRNDGLGFYRSSYVDSQGNTVWLATTQFQANEARHAFPW